MLALLISAAGSLNVFLAAGTEPQDCWNVDKATILEGGCVTVIVQKPCNESWNLTLQIDDRKPVKLLEGVGPNYHRRTSRLPGREPMLVLLYQDLTNQ
jgi:hypothetical protein